MRLLPFLILLVSCGRAEPVPEKPKGVAIACATGGSDTYAKACTVQRATRDGRALLTLNGPDGGFRRLEASTDGGSIDTADGASHARTGVGPNGEIAIQVEGDRYRLPGSGR